MCQVKILKLDKLTLKFVDKDVVLKIKNKYLYVVHKVKRKNKKRKKKMISTIKFLCLSKELIKLWKKI